jgi:hypothetical protein
VENHEEVESFFNITLHQLTATEVLLVMLSDVARLAPLEIRKVDRNDLYADCADLIHDGGYKMVAVIKQ